MEYQCYLDNLLIDEPVGFADIQLSVKRADTHGVGQEASTNKLVFFGDAFNYLEGKYIDDGIKAKVIFSAYSICGPYQTPDLLITGRLNFGQWDKQCGNTCTVSIPIEKDSCELVFTSRLSQQVDVDSMVGVDTTTALPQYGNMGDLIELPAVEINVIDEAQDSENNIEVLSDQFNWGASNTGNQISAHIAPRLDNIINSSLGIFNPSTFSQLYPGAANRPHPEFGYTVDTETLLGNIKCDFGNATFSFRAKGSHTIVANIEGISMRVKIFKLPPGSDPTSFDWVQIYDHLLDTVVDNTSTGLTHTFDWSATFTYPIVQGDRFTYSWYILSGNRFSEIVSYSVGVDKESFFKVQAPSICEPSNTQYYLLHELLSHVTEMITNGCINVKSSYYGRTDSQPYLFNQNGCGGLRFVTSGLKIRKAPDAKFFVSIKQLLDGLNAIDNIGYDVVDNILVIEAVRYFYQDKEILRCPFIPLAHEVVDETSHYAKITAGYSNWKVQHINGLDEFNSEREYKTSLETITNELKIQSDLVTGSYPIEVTRQQSFANTGAADTTYDNNVFLICVQQAMYPYSTYNVEQGGILSPENMFSPGTVLNWRIRPVANMLRWVKTIIAGYRKYTDPINKIFFSSGTGNILAKGKQEDLHCRIEVTVTQENQDIFYNQSSEYLPIWINEIVTFDYPLSVSEYNAIKATPYGYISYQCGSGDWKKGFIKEIKFNLNKGSATFTLKRKYVDTN